MQSKGVKNLPYTIICLNNLSISDFMANLKEGLWNVPKALLTNRLEGTNLIIMIDTKRPDTHQNIREKMIQDHLQLHQKHKGKKGG